MRELRIGNIRSPKSPNPAPVSQVDTTFWFEHPAQAIRHSDRVAVTISPQRGYPFDIAVGLLTATQQTAFDLDQLIVHVEYGIHFSDLSGNAYTQSIRRVVLCGTNTAKSHLHDMTSTDDNQIA